MPQNRLLFFLSPALILPLLVSLGLGQTAPAWAAEANLKNEKILDRLEAAVNASPILLSDIQRFRKVAKLRTQLDPLFAGSPLALQGSAASKSDIINFLIDEKLISQQYPTSDTEVDQEINSIQTNNRISRAELKRTLLEQGFSFEDYFELIRNSTSKRNLIERDIRSKVIISDVDIKNYYYNQVARNVSAPRSIQIQMISVSSANYKNPKAAYNIAMDALKSLKTGEDFSEVAKRVSDDPSAPSGGDLGTVLEDQVAPFIGKEVKKLSIGGVSDILEIGKPPTYVILKLVDIKSSDSTQFDKMKDQIRNQLTSQEFQHQIKLWLDRERQTAFIHRVGEKSVKETTTP